MAIEKLDFVTVSELLRRGELIEATIVADKLNRDSSTIRRWIREGKVKGVKIAGRFYVVRSSLDAFLFQEI